MGLFLRTFSFFGHLVPLPGGNNRWGLAKTNTRTWRRVERQASLPLVEANDRPVPPRRQCPVAHLSATYGPRHPILRESRTTALAGLPGASSCESLISSEASCRDSVKRSHFHSVTSPQPLLSPACSLFVCLASPSSFLTRRARSAAPFARLDSLSFTSCTAPSPYLCLATGNQKNCLFRPNTYVDDQHLITTFLSD